MAINSAMIVAGPSQQRLYVLDHRIPAHPVEPGVDYIDKVDGSPTYVIGGPPTREGQVYFHTRTLAGNRLATMYVGININSVLTWVIVFTGEVVDSYTGEEYDNLYGSDAYDLFNEG